MDDNSSQQADALTTEMLDLRNRVGAAESAIKQISEYLAQQQLRRPEAAPQ